MLAPPTPSDPAGPFDPGRPRGRVLISRANPLSTLVSRALYPLPPFFRIERGGGQP
jgi:hypothetical protein